jgi:Ni,Fe-hydrogenase I large subunit
LLKSDLGRGLYAVAVFFTASGPVHFEGRQVSTDAVPAYRPRDLLSHWVVIEDGSIKNYQAVVPTTWTASPRDTSGTLGPYESSLLQNPVADPEHPLEVLRTIHSFDPCMACAVHTFDPSGRNIAKVKVL